MSSNQDFQTITDLLRVSKYCSTFKFIQTWLHITGAGIGSVFGSLSIGYARNPSLTQAAQLNFVLQIAILQLLDLVNSQ